MPPLSRLSQAFDENQSAGGGAWNNGITRRRFLKRSGGATAATFVAWHLAETQAYGGEGGAGGSNEDTKTVKIKRVWTVTSDGTEGDGEGTDPSAAIAHAHAYQDLLDNLESDGHISRTLDESENAEVPKHYVLKNYYTTAEGETPPGPIEITDHFENPPPTEGLDYICQVSGKVKSTANKITMRWVWGEP